MLANEPTPGCLTVASPVSLFVSGLDAGKSVSHTPQRAKQFVYVTAGELTLNGVCLKKNDQARLSNEALLTFVAEADSDFVVIDLG